MLEVLDFDLTIKEVPVKIRDKDGTIKEYVLREASGDASAKYRSAQAACTDIKDGKAVRIHGIGGLEPLLVSLCLFEVVKDDAGVFKHLKAVPEATIRSWPQRVQASLYRRAVEISELEEKSGDDTQKMAETLQRWIDDHKVEGEAPTVEQLTEWLEEKDREQLGNVQGSSTDGSI